MSRPFKFSRSHQTNLRQCKRMALIRYWLDGKGYVRAGINIELGTGSLFHDIMGDILQWVLDNGQQSPPESVIRAAVKHQVTLYKAAMAAAVDEVLALGLSDSVERAGWSKVIKRQATLAESMVRCWLIVRLPYFLANYELIAVEGEEQSEISPGIVFMQRKDSVWRHKVDGTYHPLEFKTSGTATDNFMGSWHCDLQQITHLLNFKGKYDADPKSVLLEVAYKGRKYNDEHVGALVSGYKREHLDPATGEVADIEYDWVYARCKTKGWKKFFICDEVFSDDGRSSSEVWLNEVLDFETLQNHCLDTEIEHKPERIQLWLDQTRREMAGVRDGLIQLEGVRDDEAAYIDTMNVLFPANMSKDVCAPYFGSKRCSFYGVCHGQDEVTMLNETQGYTTRTPHHPGEHDE